MIQYIDLLTWTLTVQDLDTQSVLYGQNNNPTLNMVQNTLCLDFMKTGHLRIS